VLFTLKVALLGSMNLDFKELGLEYVVQGFKSREGLRRAKSHTVGYSMALSLDPK
jgi:hypothetical protein